MSYETLTLERTGHVATLTLNRPEKLNAFDQHLTREFHQALDELEGEFPDIRVLILTGEGRGFLLRRGRWRSGRGTVPATGPRV